MNPDKEKLLTAPSWEKTLRGHLAFLCMAAVAGEKGDLAAATQIVVEFCRTLASDR